MGQMGAMEIVAALKKLDANTLTPIEALSELHRLAQEAGKIEV